MFGKAGAADEGVAIAIDSSGAAYVAGNTHASTSGALFGSGPSPLPPLGRSLGRGLLAVASQPALVGLGFVGMMLALALRSRR